MIAVRVLTKEELAECVESRRAKLTRMAASMQDDPAEAEDVVQEAALNALKSVSVFAAMPTSACGSSGSASTAAIRHSGGEPRRPTSNSPLTSSMFGEIRVIPWIKRQS